jgi:hypothetical protein
VQKPFPRDDIKFNVIRFKQYVHLFSHIGQSVRKPVGGTDGIAVRVDMAGDDKMPVPF